MLKDKLSLVHNYLPWVPLAAHIHPGGELAWLMVVTDEISEHEARALQHPFVCPRIAGYRKLPYVKDLLDLGTWIGTPWIGFFNSDIILTLKFWDTFKKKEEEEEVFLTKRTDIDHVDQDPKEGARLLDDSTDGIVIRREVWLRLRDTYPDFVVGEPGWGYCTNLWVKRHGLKVHQLRNHECLHVRHEGLWKSIKSPEQERNLKLLRDYQEEYEKWARSY